MQNIPRGNTSNVKQMFTSRFPDGRMAEIDYTQLEVVIQGMLSQDGQLVKDLNNKIDFHCKRLAKKWGEDYDDIFNRHHTLHDSEVGAARTLAKEFSFQRAFGAGAPAISAATGMSVAEVKQLITEEEREYAGVIEFDKGVEREINRTRIPTGTKLYVDGTPFIQGTGHWDSPTGTRYCWTEDITPSFLHKSGKYIGFSPTERKNYPIQGTGGEIVQTMLGKVFRYFINNDRFGGDILLVNTVHDCVQLDGRGDLFTKVVLDVTAILEQVPLVMRESFKLTTGVPFPAEAEVGRDLFKMKVIEKHEH